MSEPEYGFFDRETLLEEAAAGLDPSQVAMLLKAWCISRGLEIVVKTPHSKVSAEPDERGAVAA